MLLDPYINSISNSSFNVDGFCFDYAVIICNWGIFPYQILIYVINLCNWSWQIVIHSTNVVWAKKQGKSILFVYHFYSTHCF